ncbi:CDGSH iron-sulfur domain-containing protein NEET [Malania oleifera]|uniref:CDGSH iron-sulfur domain-containing protein NEET n=1 Tax=Malania oleifera TaxID=397392 RepID=UPI0025AEB0CE|nr:CDGSH iron-sulfur domain-containing protein NEET [Malania oleifera]
MASIVSILSGGLASVPTEGLKLSRGGAAQLSCCPCSFSATSGAARRRRAVGVVRAEGINPEIRKSEEKVVDSVIVSELSKPLTAYCRCWRSRTFPLCDGSHVKHNKATGDNVGPLLLKKQ